MYYCLECGAEREEMHEWSEYRGECHGVDAYEKMAGCPNCGGAMEEMVRCDICGEEHKPDDLHGDVCDSCIVDHTNIEDCYLAGKGQEESVKINCFLAWMFTESKIEDILMDYLRKNQEIPVLASFDDKMIYDFVEEEKDWFGERLARMARERG